jgi:hypothetical protein
LGLIQEQLVALLLLGLACLAWAGYGLITGKGYYKGCPPGGFDRTRDPFSFWAPTLIIFFLGVFVILVFLGVIPFAPRSYRH